LWRRHRWRLWQRCHSGFARQCVFFFTEVFFVAVLVDVDFDDLPELDLDGFEIAFLVVLSLVECLPFVLLCFPDAAPDPADPPLRARAGGTGSFQLNASI
jgi:hypothetical protein